MEGVQQFVMQGQRYKIEIFARFVSLQAVMQEYHATIDIVTCRPIAGQLLGKHILAVMTTQATIG
jgi:predicted RecB family endonuclease